jgi:hypothetical protein
MMDALNARRTNTLLVVCSTGQELVVDAQALRKPEYASYLEALGGHFDEDRVFEIPESQFV